MKINKKAQDTLGWDYLHDILEYNPDTGLFTNKITRNSRAVKGTIAGNKVNDGYITININGYKYQAHRLAWFYELAKWPVELIDHIDRDKHNNKLNNLREATQNQNMYNSSTNKGSSKYRGVRWDRGKWKAQIKYNGKYKYLGRFNIEKDAAITYDNAAIELQGDFANINFE